jgi:CheY-like chemotaxis protein
MTTGGASTRPRVVLVDDYAPMRRLLTELLESAGCAVVGQAGDGRAALEVVEREACDTVVMDYRMPVMDGLEATRALRASHPEVVVVAFSSDDDPTVVELLLDAGAAAHFVKNDVDGLVACVSAGVPAR